MLQLAHGTKLQMGDGASPETFADVALLDNIGLPKGTRAAVDVTTHDTTNGLEKLAAALVDSGVVDIAGYIDPTDTSQGYSAGTGLRNAFEAGTIGNWKIVDPTQTWMVTFTGFVSSFTGDAADSNGQGKLTLTAAITITTGIPVFVAYS